MTTNAVAYTKAQWDKQVKDAENRLMKEANALKAQGIEIDKKELIEAVRHNKVQEYLQQLNVDVAQNKNVIDAAGNLAKVFGALGGAALLFNDESWHNKLGETYDQATNLPFSYKGGQPLDQVIIKDSMEAPQTQTPQDNGVLTTAIPNAGIAVIEYYPTMSIQEQNVQSGELQNTVRTTWNTVRSSNSGYVNGYDQCDLFQFTFSSSSLAEVLAVIVRPFNYMDAKRRDGNTWDAWDQHMLNAMTGGQANRVIRDKPQFIQILNSKLRATNAQKLPIRFDLTNRRIVLNKNVFGHRNKKDEQYIFMPLITYRYDEAKGKCVAEKFDPNAVFASPDAMANFLERLISPLVNGTATSIMAGDIKKAFPKNVATLPALKFTMKGNLFSEDENILESIRNAKPVGYAADDNIDTFSIKQKVNENQDFFIYTGELINDMIKITLNSTEIPLDATDSDQQSDAFMIDGHIQPNDPSAPTPTFVRPRRNMGDSKSDNPTKYEIMSMTRFMAGIQLTYEDYDAGNSVTVYTTITNCGTEVIAGIKTIMFNTQSEYKLNSPQTCLDGTEWNPAHNNAINASTFIKFSRSYNVFRYLPFVAPYYMAYGAAEDENLAPVFFGRWNYNKRYFTNYELDQLNIASFGSLITASNKPEDSLE